MKKKKMILKKKKAKKRVRCPNCEEGTLSLIINVGEVVCDFYGVKEKENGKTIPIFEPELNTIEEIYLKCGNCKIEFECCGYGFEPEDVEFY